MTYQLNLPYFKQGDDLHHFMSVNEENPFLAHAEMLRNAAALLEKASKFYAAGTLYIAQADTHYISVETTPEIAEQLGLDLEEEDIDGVLSSDEEV